jgi:hypothetical protein
MTRTVFTVTPQRDLQALPVTVAIRRLCHSPYHPRLHNLNAKDTARATTQDRLFEFCFDRFVQDGRIGLFLPSQSALALIGRGQPFFY